jgi:hypothetical protein
MTKIFIAKYLSQALVMALNILKNKIILIINILDYLQFESLVKFRQIYVLPINKLTIFTSITKYALLSY